MSEKTTRPGHVLVYPNREKATAKLTKLVVVVILLVSVALVAAVTIGGWSKLQGMKPLNVMWCLLDLIIAFYVGKRWSRGALPMAAGFGLLLLMAAVIAGTGMGGTSWFDRDHFGFGVAETPFGSKGFPDTLLGALTVLIVPVQLLLIMVSLYGFGQGWNEEQEMPEDEAKRHGYTPVEA